jgi:DNA primase
MAAEITEAVLEEIKARVDLADLIASYGIDVKVAGSSKKACCPFHREKTPSFMINEARGFYHCFGCGESGDAIKFVMKMEGLSFVEAVKKLAEQCHVKIEAKEDPKAGQRRRLYALLAELAAFYHRCLLKAGEAKLARDYLASRELDAKIQEDYLIGYAPKGVANILKWAEKYRYTPEELELAGVIRRGDRPGDDGYHRFGGRLMFSIRDKQGRVVGFSGRQLVEAKNTGKYVNSPETPVFSKKRILYGFDKAMRAIAQDRQSHEAIVCEGQIDCIRLQTRGFPNAVAGQGTAFTGEHVAMLKKVSDLVTLVYDDDGAGHAATVKSARLCLAAGLPVRVVSLPGGDDPDSFLRTHPAEDFRKMLDAAESIMSFQVRAERLKEKNPDTIDAVDRVTKAVLTTIAACPNEVLKAAMTGEAAKLLGLPAAALAEELAKVRVEKKLQKIEEAGEDERAREEFEALEARYSGDAPAPFDAADASAADANAAPDDSPDAPAPDAEDAADALPPPPRETALCAFLMANEYDATLDGMLAEFLPPDVFAHPFTGRFVDVWRQECAKGEDLFAAFADGLSPRERKWFDAILLSVEKSQGSALSATDILQEFVRSVWSEALARRRGALPAAGDAESELKRMQLTLDLKRLSSARWHVVKDMIRGMLSSGA